MENTEKCQVIKCQCGKISGGSISPHCYTDKDWLKEIKQAIKEGYEIDLISVNDFKMEDCVCSTELFNQISDEDLGITDYDDSESQNNDDSILFKVPIKDVNFKNMLNDNEFYLVIDLAYGKRIHRAVHIRTHPNAFLFVYLQKSQLK